MTPMQTSRRRARADCLEDRFHLTHSEACLVLHLVEGASLKSSAKTLGVTYETELPKVGLPQNWNAPTGRVGSESLLRFERSPSSRGSRRHVGPRVAHGGARTRYLVGSYRMFKARHEMIALGALLVVAVVALVVFEIAHLGHLHF